MMRSTLDAVVLRGVEATNQYNGIGTDRVEGPALIGIFMEGATGQQALDVTLV
jgi:hypothetical protein